MPRLAPLPAEHTPELKEHFSFFVGTLGFVPNSVLTMQRKPRLVKALAALNGAAMDPQGEIDLGFKRLVGHFASRAAGSGGTRPRPPWRALILPGAASCSFDIWSRFAGRGQIAQPG